VVQSSVDSDGALLSAAILAGGRAQRFGGADKSALVVGGTRIIDRQLAALASVTGDVRLVSNDARRYPGLGIPVIEDAIPGAGPLGGLYSALLDARHDRVLILACDLPFVTPELLQRLVDESAGRDDIDAVVPRSSRGLEPLCALYRRRCADAARRRIERGALRVVELLTDLRIREIGPDALGAYDTGSLFENVNTPHDHARARGLVEVNEKSSEDRITE
jgi:molybdenum cofactor guanylyltransferase